MTLHEDLLAELDRRERNARIPAEDWGDDDWPLLVQDPEIHVSDQMREYLEDVGPADALRRYACLREELAEHDEADCHYCADPDDPCPDVRRWARSLGIEVSP